MELIDSHTHLDAPEFDADRDDVLLRARAAGVKYLLTVGAGDGFNSAERAVALAARYPAVFASVGVHPQNAGTAIDPERLLKLAGEPRVLAIGETGLDFYRDWAPREAQERWFRIQIEIAIAVGKPLIIHSRDAGEQCLKLLRETGAERVGGVFHCYAENHLFAQRLQEINFLVSFTGVVSFKNAGAVQAAARAIPLEQIMIETDAPYMAPVPHRGKRCESAFVADTAQALANIRGVTLEEVAQATTANAQRLFRFGECQL